MTDEGIYGDLNSVDLAVGNGSAIFEWLSLGRMDIRKIRHRRGHDFGFARHARAESGLPEAIRLSVHTP